MAGHLDVGQPEHGLGCGLQLRALLGVQAMGGHFGLDDRHGLWNAVAHEHVAQQHLGRQRAAGQFGQRGESIAVHMRQQQAAAVFGGGVGDGDGRQPQGLCEEGEGVYDPAVLVGTRNLHIGVGFQDVPAPGHECAGYVGLAAAIAHPYQNLCCGGGGGR